MFERIKSQQSYLVITDILLINIAFGLALLLRFDGRVPGHYMLLYQQTAVFITLIYGTTFYFFGLYKKLWQYASIKEVVLISVAVTTAAVFIVATRWFGILFPRSVYIISWAFNLLFIGGSRFAFRGAHTLLKRKTPGNMVRVLIIGAGEAGAMVANEIEKNREKLLLEAVGFIDDDLSKKGMFMHDVPILGSRNEIPRIIRERDIDEIIIAIPSAPRKTIRDIVAICGSMQVKLRILPGVYELIEGKVSLKELRDVVIEDLLKRESINVDLEEIAAYLKDQVVLITGAGGSIGSEICRQITPFKPKQLLLFGHGENSIYHIYEELKNCNDGIDIVPLIGSIQDKGRLEEIFSLFKPSVIFHAAAHKHVPLMEDNPKEAIKNNVFGTTNVAETAHKYKAKKFVLISTDKAVNPTSVMGASKRIAEMVMQVIAKKSQTHFCAVRFGNVLGSRGSVVPLFRKQISLGGPVTITHPEMVRFFMTIPEAVQLVIQAGAMGNNGEVFILDMGEPVKIVELATDLIRLSGYEPGKDIDIVFTGIRPGEKICEEILTKQEGVGSTKHEKIFIAKANNLQGFVQEIEAYKDILQIDGSLITSFVPGLRDYAGE